jgi:hypothetical protein
MSVSRGHFCVTGEAGSVEGSGRGRSVGVSSAKSGRSAQNLLEYEITREGQQATLSGHLTAENDCREAVIGGYNAGRDPSASGPLHASRTPIGNPVLATLRRGVSYRDRVRTTQVEP